MKVLIKAYENLDWKQIEGEIDDPADCVVGNRATVRVLPVIDPEAPQYASGEIIAVEPA